MKLRSILVFLLLVLPIVASALGLGKLELDSGLNQPLKAKIVLISATADDLAEIEVGLADPLDFERVGIARPFVLSGLRFSIKETPEGADYVQIISRNPIREPFLHFLVKVSWSKGLLFREYTVLLDPVGYQYPAVKKQTIKKQIIKKQTIKEQAIKEQKIGTDKQTIAPVSRPVRTIGSEYGPAITGDTLWDISKIARAGSSVSIQQMMIAILQANPEAFIENNINGLKRGAVLQIPDASNDSFISRAGAFAKTHEQNLSWDDYKGLIRRESDVSHVQPPVIPELEEPIVDVEPVVDAEIEKELPVEPVVDAEIEKELPVDGESQLQLITEPDQQITGGQGATPSDVDLNALNDALAVANESIDVLTMANNDVQTNLDNSEEIIVDLQRLIELKENELATLQAQAVATKAEDQLDEETEEGVEDVAEAGDVSLLTNLLNQVKDNLVLVVAAVGGFLLLVFGMLFVLRRYKEKKMLAEFLRETDGTGGLDQHAGVGSDSDVLPNVDENETVVGDDSDEFDIPDPNMATAMGVEESADPMEEVNVFIAYEHFDEAETFIREALQREPNNLRFYIKLLEVFYASGNKRGYEKTARILQEKTGGDGDDWDMALVMWSEMSPNRNLFEEAAHGEEDDDAIKQQVGEVVDITNKVGDDPLSGTVSMIDDVLDATAPREEEDMLSGTMNSLDMEMGGVVDDEEEMGSDTVLDITAEPLEATLSPETDLSEELIDIEFDSGELGELDMSDLSGEVDQPLEVTTKMEPSEELMDVEFDSGELGEPDMIDLTDEAGQPLEITTKIEPGEELMDVEFDSGELGEPDMIDLTGEVDQSLEITTKMEPSEDLIDFDSDAADDGLLDISVDSGAADDGLLDISVDSGAADDGLLDISIDSGAADDELLDISIDSGAADDGLLDISIDSDAADDELLDISIDSGAADDELLDISIDSDAAAEPAPDILDVTASLSLGEDIMDVSDEQLLDISVDAKTDITSLTVDEDFEDFDDDKTFLMPKPAQVAVQSEDEEMASHLDLAKAYIELSENESATTILNEIIEQGSEEYRNEAKELLKQIT